MLTGHNYIVFLSEKYRGCDFPGHVLPPRNHHKPVCWYSMRRSWIPASLSCVPDVHSTSGYLFFSTGAVSVFSFPISSPASPDTRTRSHLHGFLPHILQSHLQSFFQVLCSNVSYMPIFPVSAQRGRHLWEPDIKIKTGMVFLRSMYQMFYSIKTLLCIRDFCLATGRSSSQNKWSILYRKYEVCISGMWFYRCYIPN